MLPGAGVASRSDNRCVMPCSVNTRLSGSTGGVGDHEQLAALVDAFGGQVQRSRRCRPDRHPEVELGQLREAVLAAVEGELEREQLQPVRGRPLRRPGAEVVDRSEALERQGDRVRADDRGRRRLQQVGRVHGVRHREQVPRCRRRHRRGDPGSVHRVCGHAGTQQCHAARCRGGLRRGRVVERLELHRATGAVRDQRELQVRRVGVDVVEQHRSAQQRAGDVRGVRAVAGTSTARPARALPCRAAA